MTDTISDIEVSGQYGVPVLVDREHDVDGMAESGDIVEYTGRRND